MIAQCVVKYPLVTGNYPPKTPSSNEIIIKCSFSDMAVAVMRHDNLSQPCNNDITDDTIPVYQVNQQRNNKLCTMKTQPRTFAWENISNANTVTVAAIDGATVVSTRPWRDLHSPATLRCEPSSQARASPCVAAHVTHDRTWTLAAL